MQTILIAGGSLVMGFLGWILGIQRGKKVAREEIKENMLLRAATEDPTLISMIAMRVWEKDPVGCLIAGIKTKKVS